MNNIKMRVNAKKDSLCENCGVKWMNTKEMYDMMFCGRIFTICCECVDNIFQKTLSANVKYNGKIKTKEDMERIKRSNQLKEIGYE